jgi:hypothetical protein
MRSSEILNDIGCRVGVGAQSVRLYPENIERSGMISIIERVARPIFVDERRRSRFDTHHFVTLRFDLRSALRDLSNAVERRFAAFAAVPYHDPCSRRQWEQIFETEAELSNE